MSDREQLNSELSSLRLGELNVGQAAVVVRNALKNNDMGVRVYDALRGLAFIMLTSPSRNCNDPYYGHWCDFYTHAAELAHSKGDCSLHDRICALSDLIGQSSRFADNHSLDEVMQRKSFVKLLEHVAQSGGTVVRRELPSPISTEVGLSRTLVILTTLGLLDRKGMGGESEFSLTGLAYQQLGMVPPRPSTEPHKPTVKNPQA